MFNFTENKSDKQFSSVSHKLISIASSYEDQYGFAKIPIPNSRDGEEYLFIKDIIYIQALSSYCKIFLSNGKYVVVSKTLKKVASILVNYNFYRIHNSYLINLHFIDNNMPFKGLQVTLQNGTQLEISRRKYIEFKKMIRQNILGFVA
jgi:two-component system, LytTR family, response regulator